MSENGGDEKKRGVEEKDTRDTKSNTAVLFVQAVVQGIVRLFRCGGSVLICRVYLLERVKSHILWSDVIS